MWSPEAKGRSLTENTSFLRIQHRPTPPKSLSGHWRNSGFQRIGGHIRRTLICWTSTPGAFCRQNPKLSLTQILPPYVCPSPRNKTGKQRYVSATHRFSPANVSTHLLRAFETACGPLGPEGRSLTENSPFDGFSASLRRPNQLAAVGRILVFGGLAAIFAELEFAGLLNWQRFAAKRPGYASR